MARLDPTGVSRILSYIKNWVTAALGGKANSSHSHTKSQITDFPTIPSKTSQLTNDSGFLTAHQSLSNYSTLANTVKSLSISGKTITVTPGSGSAYTLTTQDTNTTYSNFVKSGSGAKAGLVPAPSTTAGTTKYLREDGTWQVPPDHTYTVNNATLTIQKNGSNVATFTSNASSNVTANITVPTNTNQLTNGAGYITSSGSCASCTTAGQVSTSVAAGSTKALVYSSMADNDQFRILVGGASNAGYVEIATSDDGNEPIYVRQYNNGTFGSIVRTLTLLDGSGNTQFPGTVSAPTFTGNVTGNCSGTAGSVAWDNVSGKPSAFTPYFANGTWYAVGDDAAIGDHNVGGGLGVKALNSTTTRIDLCYKDDTSNFKSITYDGTTLYMNGNCDYANSAGNSDTLDGIHEYSFLRYRGETSTSGEGTLWGQIGIKGYYNALPDGLSGVYQWGEVVSLAGGNVRFDIYCSHQSSDGNGLYYRSGWGDDKKAWRRLIDDGNTGNISISGYQVYVG